MQEKTFSHMPDSWASDPWLYAATKDHLPTYHMSFKNAVCPILFADGIETAHFSDKFMRKENWCPTKGVQVTVSL